jgi:hypothetical protein
MTGQSYVIGVLGFFATLPHRATKSPGGSPTNRRELQSMAVSKADNATDSEDVITMDRRDHERRSNDVAERRQQNLESRGDTPPRRKKQRRRHIDPTTCERDYTELEIEFMRAMDIYKRDSGRMFPTCSEVLEVIRALGYYKLNDEQLEQLDLARVEEIAATESDEDAECDPLDEEFDDE